MHLVQVPHKVKQLPIEIARGMIASHAMLTEKHFSCGFSLIVTICFLEVVLFTAFTPFQKKRLQYCSSFSWKLGCLSFLLGIPERPIFF